MAKPERLPEKKDPEKSKSLVIDDSITEDALQIIETAKTIDPKLFDGISHQKKQSLVRGLALSMSIQKSHSGPLPDPETLDAYNRIIGDGAERIMQMAEKEQNARLDDRKRFTDRMMNQSSLGQIFGFVICMSAIIGGIYLSSIGKETSGISAIITALVALAGAFLYVKAKEK